jgi:hypothetical protein
MKKYLEFIKNMITRTKINEGIAKLNQFDMKRDSYKHGKYVY